MGIEDLIKNRRTIQSFTEESVPAEVIEKAVELAMYAPNHRLTFPWRFYKTNRSFREEIAKIQIDLKSAKSPLSEAAKSSMMRKIVNEGELLIVGINKNSDPETHKEDYASLACALQNMALYLWENNYGSKWGSGKVTQHEKVYEFIKKNSNEFLICGFFWLGRFQAIPPMARRPDLKDILI